MISIHKLVPSRMLRHRAALPAIAAVAGGLLVTGAFLAAESPDLPVGHASRPVAPELHLAQASMMLPSTTELEVPRMTIAAHPTATQAGRGQRATSPLVPCSHWRPLAMGSEQVRDLCPADATAAATAEQLDDERPAPPSTLAHLRVPEQRLPHLFDPRAEYERLAEHPVL